MNENEIIATATINPVREAVMASLEPDNLAGVLIEGTSATVRAVGPLPLPHEDMDWLVCWLTQKACEGSCPPNCEIVFNRYCAWIVKIG